MFTAGEWSISMFLYFFVRKYGTWICDSPSVYRKGEWLCTKVEKNIVQPQPLLHNGLNGFVPMYYFILSQFRRKYILSSILRLYNQGFSKNRTLVQISFCNLFGNLVNRAFAFIPCLHRVKAPAGGQWRPVGPQLIHQLTRSVGRDRQNRRTATMVPHCSRPHISSLGLAFRCRLRRSQCVQFAPDKSAHI